MNTEVLTISNLWALKVFCSWITKEKWNLVVWLYTHRKDFVCKLGFVIRPQHPYAFYYYKSVLIIIQIIKVCSMHKYTLLGAQGVETKKNTWIRTIYSDSKNKIMYRDTCTMQLQIYIIFEKLWHKMSLNPFASEAVYMYTKNFFDRLSDSV